MGRKSYPPAQNTTFIESGLTVVVEESFRGFTYIAYDGTGSPVPGTAFAGQKTFEEACEKARAAARQAARPLAKR